MAHDETTPWAKVSRRMLNPVQVLATIHKHDAAWYFALLGWILPVMIVGFPIALNPALARGRGFFPSFSAFAWLAVILAYVCLVAPTIVTSEREGGTLDSLRMTRLTAVDLVLGKLKPRLPEIGLLLGGGALFLSIFFVWGSLSLPSLLLLWISGPIYAAAYMGFGAASSIWCQRSSHSIIAGWGLLLVPMMLSLAFIKIAGALGRWIILPLAPLLVSYRCLVFDLPDPTPGGIYLPAAEAYAIWGLSLALHAGIAVVSWWIALKAFDRFLWESRTG